MNEHLTYILQILQHIEKQCQNILNEWEHGQDMALFSHNAYALSAVIASVNRIVPQEIYGEYRDFFVHFNIFCGQCQDMHFMQEHIDDMISLLCLTAECIEDLYGKCSRRMRTCICCGRETVYHPVSDCDAGGLICPVCGADDQARLLTAFLKKERLRDAEEGTRVLQIAPDAVVGQWITQYCPQTVYESIELFRNENSMPDDLQSVQGIADESYDVIVCSGISQAVWRECKTVEALRRILKPAGRILYGMSGNLEEEAADRVREQFCVHSFGKVYFGQELLRQCAVKDTSVLYMMTKTTDVPTELAEQVVVDETLCKEGPLVSVIMSCYNHEPFVAAAIESVIHQSYQNIEFIVADDASTDRTAEIMKQYASHYAKAVYFEDNYGGRSEYLQQFATGKYIALMHSDDVWEENKLALQVAYMERHGECGACLTWCMYTDENLKETDETIFLKTNRSSGEWMDYFWDHGNALCNPSSLVRREIAANVRKNPCSQLPDFFKWVDIVQHTTIHVIPKVLVWMRRYHKDGRENTSAYSRENEMRSMMEQGANWLYVIRDMEAAFFRQAFGGRMIDPGADTEEEIKCEKYFLMLGHSNPCIQYSAMCYFSEIFHEVKECMENKYHYSYKSFRRDIVEKGLAAVLCGEKKEEHK